MILLLLACNGDDVPANAASVVDVEVNGTPIRIVRPDKPRFKKQAPIVLELPGVHARLNATLTADDTDALLKAGFIVVSFLYPGECDEGRCAEGDWDQWGDASIQSLRSVIDWIPESLPELAPEADPHNFGVLARSLGGNHVTEAMAEEALPLNWLVLWESPQSDQLVISEFGNPKNPNPGYVPEQCTPIAGCPVNLETLQLSDTPRKAHDFGDDSGTVTVAHSLFLDTNRDGVMAQNEYSFPTWVARFDGNLLAIHSQMIVDAMQRLGLPAPEIATPSQHRSYWAHRDPRFAWATALAHHPSLPIMLLYTNENHVPNPVDDPQAQMAWQGWSGAAWLRFNPDSVYLPRDNEVAANTAYSYDTMIHALVDGGDGDIRWTGVAEMADRTEHNNWDDNLDQPLQPGLW